MDRLQAMQIFARIAEQGSFTRVAEQLRLPRPTVTHAVQYLESDVLQTQKADINDKPDES